MATAELRSTGTCTTATSSSATTDGMILRATPTGQLDELMTDQNYHDYLVAQGILTTVTASAAGLMSSAQLATLNSALSSVDLTYTASTRVLSNTGGTNVTLPEVDSSD